MRARINVNAGPSPTYSRRHARGHGSPQSGVTSEPSESSCNWLCCHHRDHCPSVLQFGGNKTTQKATARSSCYFLQCCKSFTHPLAQRLRFLLINRKSLLGIMHEKTASTAACKGHGLLTPFRVLYLFSMVASVKKRMAWASGRRGWIGNALVGSGAGQLFAQKDNRNPQTSSFRLVPTGGIVERQSN